MAAAGEGSGPVEAGRGSVTGDGTRARPPRTRAPKARAASGDAPKVPAKPRGRRRVPAPPPSRWARLRARAAARPALLRRGGLAAALCTLWVLGGCGGAYTGEVGRACLQAGRSGASMALCSCVQQAADQTLSAQDQRRAAGFFADPQEAQETRQSDASRDEAFWARYRAFTDRAEAICG